jgi:uncharacterized membrane protein
MSLAAFGHSYGTIVSRALDATNGTDPGSAAGGCGNMSTAEAERNAQRLFLGIFIATLGGFVSSFGLVMQKLAHKVNEGLPPEEKSTFKVILGFACYISGTLIVVSSMPFAPQSIIAALTSVNLVGNAVFAPCLLKEKITKIDIVGTLFVVLGIVLVVIFGQKCSLSYTAEQLVDFFLAGGQVIYFTFMMLTIIAVVVYIRLTEANFWVDYDRAERMKKEAEQREAKAKILEMAREVNRITGSPSDTASVPKNAGDIEAQESPSSPARKSIVRRLTEKQQRTSIEYGMLYNMQVARGKKLAFFFAFLSAALAAYGTILVKIVGTLIETSFTVENQFVKLSTWVFIIALVAFEVIHIQYLNQGLKCFEAMFFVPLFQVCITCLTSISGGIFFQEFVDFTLIQQVMYPLGLATTVTGVFILTQRDASITEGVDHSSGTAVVDNSSNIRRRATSWPPPRKKEIIAFEETLDDIIESGELEMVDMTNKTSSPSSSADTPPSTPGAARRNTSFYSGNPSPDSTSPSLARGRSLSSGDVSVLIAAEEAQSEQNENSAGGTEDASGASGYASAGPQEAKSEEAEAVETGDEPERAEEEGENVEEREMASGEAANDKDAEQEQESLDDPIAETEETKDDEAVPLETAERDDEDETDQGNASSTE